MPERAKQEGRSLSISTPLGKDELLINRFTAHEGLSELFSIEAEVWYDHGAEGVEPHVIDPADILGKPVTIAVATTDDVSRHFSGIVNRFAQGNRDGRFTHYSLSIVPHVWLLTQISQSRIFQQKSVSDILKKVFKGFQTEYELGSYEPRNYCVQYRETDFAFASRLMEEEGIFYYFKHADGKHTMVIADNSQSNRECPERSTIPFVHNVGSEEAFVGAIHSFLPESKLQTGKVTLWDHNFQLPTNNLSIDKQSNFNFGDNKKLEFYDYPGGYARKFDGIGSGGNEQPSELNKVYSDRQVTAERMMQGLESRCETITGTSDVCSLTAGYRFALINHANSSLDRNYVLTSVTHHADQSPDYYSTSQTNENAYDNSFSCIKHGSGVPTFRPEYKTKKPVVHGSQTAVVVGPAGEEIFTDKYGRVKVQFYWDREGQVSESSSCWMRVAQPWAGNNWGTMFIPRVGMEVLIHFLEGDPDQPIITGCVYNPQTMPPYTLPNEKNKSGIKTNSTKGGGGYNELRFDDTKGSEQIFIHGQRNEDILIENDCMESIGKDRHLTVGGKQIESVGGDVHLTVSGDRNEKVGGNLSVDIGAKVDEKVGSSYALKAGTTIELNAGMSAVVEAGTSLTLKVGGNFININSAGIFIKGTMVMINSGGAAGAGPGCNTTTPEKPKAADKAEAGKHIQQINKPPAKQSPKFASLAAMTAKAGKKGQKPTKEEIAKIMASIDKAVADARAAALREAAKETASQVGKMISATALAIPFVGRAVGAGE